MCLFLLVVCVCLAFSAFYEGVEWWTAAIVGEAADSFVATQGDIWDTRCDMFPTPLGAVASQTMLHRLHDRQITVLSATKHS